AHVGDFFRKRDGRNAGMLIRERRESGNVEFASEFCTVDGVVERVEPAQLIDGRSGVPEIGARQLIHGRAGQIVDHEERKGRRTGGEEKIGAVASPGCSLLQVFGVEGGSGGVAEGWAGRLGEFDELRRGEFLRHGWKRRENQENRETERDKQFVKARHWYPIVLTGLVNGLYTRCSV